MHSTKCSRIFLPAGRMQHPSNIRSYARVYRYRKSTQISCQWLNSIPKRRLLMFGSERARLRGTRRVEAETVVVTIDLDVEGDILGLELIGVKDFTIQSLLQKAHLEHAV